MQIMTLHSRVLIKAGVKERFIIEKVDRKRVNTPNDLQNALLSKCGWVLFEGIYPNEKQAY